MKTEIYIKFKGWSKSSFKKAVYNKCQLSNNKKSLKQFSIISKRTRKISKNKAHS